MLLLGSATDFNKQNKIHFKESLCNSSNWAAKGNQELEVTTDTTNGGGGGGGFLLNKGACCVKVSYMYLGKQVGLYNQGGTTGILGKKVLIWGNNPNNLAIWERTRLTEEKDPIEIDCQKVIIMANNLLFNK